MLAIRPFKAIIGAITAILVAIVLMQPAYAQASSGELIEDTEHTYLGQITEVIKTEKRTVITGLETEVQTLSVRLIDGSYKGKVVEVRNDYAPLKEGDKLYIRHTVRWEDGVETFYAGEPYRLPFLFWITVAFIVLTIIFGGMQGVRGLVSLFGSLALIVYVLLPGISSGFSPLLIALGVSSLIIILGSYVTHGFTKTTSSAVIGMIITVIVTGLLSYYSVYGLNMTGFETEEAVFLNIKTAGAIDFRGLLLGGILIGLLGVLYDVAIGQAVTVEELSRFAPHASRKAVYLRAVRIGREHIGALVNTLAIAYVGASLPLLLLLYVSAVDVVPLLNREMFAAEIVRTMIGSIGLVLAVPITTLFAVTMLIKKHTDSPELTQKQNELLKSFEGHGHSHGHNHGSAGVPHVHTDTCRHK